MNTVHQKEQECKALSQEKEKYWTQLTYLMKQNHSHGDSAHVREEDKAFEQGLLRKLEKLEREKLSIMSICKEKATSLAIANRRIEDLIRQLSLREHQLMDCRRRLVEREAPQTPSAHGFQSSLEPQDEVVLIAAKEMDPDREAMALGVLLSKQLEKFGTTMFESMRPEDEPLIAAYCHQGGFSREEAILLIFEQRFGSVSSQQHDGLAVHPALPHLELSSPSKSLVGSVRRVSSRMDVTETLNYDLSPHVEQVRTPQHVVRRVPSRVDVTEPADHTRSFVRIPSRVDLTEPVRERTRSGSFISSPTNERPGSTSRVDLLVQDMELSYSSKRSSRANSRRPSISSPREDSTISAAAVVRALLEEGDSEAERAAIEAIVERGYDRAIAKEIYIRSKSDRGAIH